MTQRKDDIHNSQFTIHNSQLAPHPHHPLAWITWLAGVLVALTTTRNPWYIALVLAMIALVLAVQGKRQEENAALAAPVISPLKFAVVTVSFSALFNAAMVHIGTTVLFTLPAAIPLIGGPVTLEALVYGALNGLVLAGLFAAFTVLNRVLSVRAALRLVPRAYYPVAVVMSIAVTFVPTTLHQIQQIREAQAVRGHRLRGARSWLPLVIPLLEGGLERSMQLAEAMMARGFASAEQHADARPRLILLVGLVGLVGGWLLQLVWKMQVIGALLLLVSAVSLIGGLWLAGRQHPHTVYRPEAWHGRDWFVVVGAVITVAVYLLPWPGLDRSSIFYYPYPTLSWPEFSPVIGVATLGLIAPALV